MRFADTIFRNIRLRNNIDRSRVYLSLRDVTTRRDVIIFY